MYCFKNTSICQNLLRCPFGGMVYQSSSVYLSFIPFLAGLAMFVIKKGNFGNDRLILRFLMTTYFQISVEVRSEEKEESVSTILVLFLISRLFFVVCNVGNSSGCIVHISQRYGVYSDMDSGA